jgi:hypothetical protein
MTVHGGPLATIGRLGTPWTTKVTTRSGRDTSPAMSQEDIEAFERGLRAYNQQDIEALLEGLESRGGVVPGGSEDQGDQVVAIGRLRTRGRASGLVTEAPLGYVTDFRNGIATRIRTYLDPSEALEAAGLSE